MKIALGLVANQRELLNVVFFSIACCCCFFPLSFVHFCLVHNCQNE